MFRNILMDLSNCISAGCYRKTTACSSYRHESEDTTTTYFAEVPKY
jgi:hypothetical protein